MFIYQVGVPINSANQMDVYQENEELKEEVQKLAAKVWETFYILWIFIHSSLEGWILQDSGHDIYKPTHQTYKKRTLCSTNQKAGEL